MEGNNYEGLLVKAENNINEKRKKEDGYIKKDGEEKGKGKGGTKI